MHLFIVFFFFIFAYFSSHLGSWEPGQPVKTAEELEEAITAANAGDPNGITFAQRIDLYYDGVFQPLNANSVLEPTGRTFTIDGQGSTLKTPHLKSDPSPGFFIRGGTGVVTIKDLTFENSTAKGGNGGQGGVNQGGAGGGGLGAGGAIFLHERSEVILEGTVTFKSCKAVGGHGYRGPPDQDDPGGGSGGGGGSLRGGNGGRGSLFSPISSGGGSGAGFESHGVDGSSPNKGGGAGGSGFRGLGGRGGKVGGGGGGGGGNNGGNADVEDAYISGAGGSGDGNGGQGNDSTSARGGDGGIGSDEGLGGEGGKLRGGGGSGAVGGDGGKPGGIGVGGKGGSGPGGGGGGGGGKQTGGEGDQNTGKGGDGGPGFGGGGGGVVTLSGGSTVVVGGDGGASVQWGGGGGGGGGDTKRGRGGKGGFGGGGGGAGGFVRDRSVALPEGGQGGGGGFGGGGGGGSSTGFTLLKDDTKNGQNWGGDGGFGGGGGGAGGNYEPGSEVFGGVGGFGGGAGTAAHNKRGDSGGGGALGGAIFLQEGSKLTIKGELAFEGSLLTPGQGANSGEKYGKDIFMMSGSTLIFASDRNIKISTGIRSNEETGKGGGLVKKGNGTLRLTHEDEEEEPDKINDYTGETILSQGVLHVGKDASLGSLKDGAEVPLIFTDEGGVLKGGVLELDNGFISGKRPIRLKGRENTICVTLGSATLGGEITGGGPLFKKGAGTLILKGSNKYTGGTYLVGGILEPETDQAIGTTGVLTFRGGTLSVKNGFSYSRTIDLESGGGTITIPNGSATLSGMIGGVGVLKKKGAGTLVLTRREVGAKNTYKGGTHLLQGVLKPNKDAALGADSSALTLSGGTLLLAGGDFTSSPREVTVDGPATIQTDVDVDLSGVFSGSGTLTKTGSGQLTLSHPSDRHGATKLTQGTLQLTPRLFQGNIDISPQAFLIFDQKENGRYEGTLLGSGGVTKKGGETLTLSHPSRHSGPITISEGILKLIEIRALGQASPLNIEKDGILSIATDLHILQVNVLNGEGSVNIGTNTLEVKRGTFSGIISSGLALGGLTKVKAGDLLTLTGHSTYRGPTTIQAGTLDLGATGIPGEQNDLHIYGGRLTLGGPLGERHPGLEVRALIGTKDATIALNNNRLRVQSGTFAGVIEGAFGSSLEKTQEGTLTLTGTRNTFEKLLLKSGTLECSSGAQLGNLLLLEGGTLAPLQTLSIKSPIEVTKQSTVTVRPPLILTLEGALTGSHTLTKMGSGTLVIDSDSSPFREALVLRAGTLILPKGRHLGEKGQGGVELATSDATLIGAGHLGFLKNSRGTVEMGSSGSPERSTLHIDGNYDQGEDATLKIRITPSPDQSDLLKVAGTATLDGVLFIDPQPGIYLAGTTYNILEAQAVQNRFSKVMETHPLDFNIKLEGMNVLSSNQEGAPPNQDNLQIKIAFTEAVLPLPLSSLKGNARQIGDYLFSCRHSPSEELTSILQSLVQLPPKEFIAGLLQLGPQQFGEIALSNLESNVRIAHAANRVKTLYHTRFLPPSEHVTPLPDPSPSHLSHSKWIAPSIGSSLLNARPPVEPSQRSVKRSIWMTPIGFYYKRDQKGEHVPFTSWTYGFTAGYTFALDSLALNVGAGYSDSHLKWSKYHGDAQIQAAYASPSFGYVGGWGYAGMVLSFARRFYDVKRGIHFSEVNRKAESKHRSHDLLAGFSGALKVKVSDSLQKNLSLMLAMRLDYLSIFESAYTEVRAGSLNLLLERRHSAFFRSELMFKVLKQMDWKSMHISPIIFFGWVVHLPLTRGQYSASLQEETCQEHLRVKSNPLSRDQITVGGELFVNRTDRFSFKMGYQVGLMDRAFIQEGKLSLSWDF